NETIWHIVPDSGTRVFCHIAKKKGGWRNTFEDGTHSPLYLCIFKIECFCTLPESWGPLNFRQAFALCSLSFLLFRMGQSHIAPATAIPSCHPDTSLPL